VSFQCNDALNVQRDDARSWGGFGSSRCYPLDEALDGPGEPRQVEGEYEGKDQGGEDGSSRSGDSVLERIVRETKDDVEHDPCCEVSHSKHDVVPKLRV